MFPHSIWAWLAAAICAYLLGSVSGGLIASFTRHKEDLRRHGSGNAGMTNALRTYGVRSAVLVLAIDTLKTVFAVLLARLLLGEPWGTVVGGACAVLGHDFPVYYRFRGGKGVLSSAVVVALLDWRVFLISLAVFALAVLLSGRVSVGSLSVAVAAPVCCLLLQEGTVQELFVAALGALLIFTHRSNLRRLLRGEEPKTVIAKRRSL